MTIPLRLAPTGYPTASPAALAEPTCRVHPVVRVALFLYILSIPFELPQVPLPLEVPTLTGALFLATTLFSPGAAFRRIPSVVWWFGLFLWVLALASILMGVEHRALAARHFLHLLQLVLIIWTMGNLLADRRVLRDVLVAIVIGTTARAIIQVTGIATTHYELWGGGERLSAFGQNANLSAMILTGGLVTVLGMLLIRDPSIPRLGWLALPLAGVLGWAIVQTGSRGGIVCAGVGLTAFCLTGRDARQRLRNAAIGVLALAAMLWGVLSTEALRERFGAAAQEGALAGRERIWPAALEMIQERPLVGWGVADNQYEVGWRIAAPRGTRDTHNLLLELFSSSGLLGGFPFLIGIGLCLAGAWKARRGRLGVLPLAMLLAILTATMSGTWMASKILWLALTLGWAAGAHWTPRPALPSPWPHVRPGRTL